MGKLNFANYKGSSASRNIASVVQARKSDNLISLEIAKICPSPFNDGLPMDENDTESLAASIKENGLLSPISVYDMKDGTYQVFSGHRRIEAMKRNGEDFILANVFPFEEDTEKRFQAHLDANVQTRKKDLRFRIAELKQARLIIQEKFGTSLSKADEVQKLTELLSKDGTVDGFSRPQIYRLNSLEKLSEEVLMLEQKANISAFTLSLASGLSDMQQHELAEQILSDVQKDDGETEITRVKFQEIIDKIKGSEKKAPVKAKKKELSSTWKKSRTSYMKNFKKIKSEQERELAISEVSEMIASLQELERNLKELEV